MGNRDPLPPTVSPRESSSTVSADTAQDWAKDVRWLVLPQELAQHRYSDESKTSNQGKIVVRRSQSQRTSSRHPNTSGSSHLPLASAPPSRSLSTRSAPAPAVLEPTKAPTAAPSRRNSSSVRSERALPASTSAAAFVPATPTYVSASDSASDQQRTRTKSASMPMQTRTQALSSPPLPSLPHSYSVPLPRHPRPPHSAHSAHSALSPHPRMSDVPELDEDLLHVGSAASSLPSSSTVRPGSTVPPPPPPPTPAVTPCSAPVRAPSIRPRT
ncbi:hypothetical protein DACRYDRAFT_19637, partial [Dacryopinax primogenitus]